MAYDNLDPQGKQRDDLNMGIICRSIFTAAGVKNSKASDFMHDYEKEDVPVPSKSNARIFAIFKQATLAHGGKVIG